MTKCSLLDEHAFFLQLASSTDETSAALLVTDCPVSVKAFLHYNLPEIVVLREATALAMHLCRRETMYDA